MKAMFRRQEEEFKRAVRQEVRGAGRLRAAVVMKLMRKEERLQSWRSSDVQVKWHQHISKNL